MIYKMLKVTALDCEYLAKLINTALSEGWELYGNPFAINTSIVQALIQKEDADCPPRKEQ